MNEQTKKVAIVTGSSRGIGAAIAKRLALDGFAIVINYAGSRDKAEEVVNQIQFFGGDAIAVQGDVSKPKDVESLFDAAEHEYGGVDILVNNAGIQTQESYQYW